MRDCSGTEDTPQDLADLAASALVHWGKQASAIRLVKVRENAVFRVVDPAGGEFALRIHHKGNHGDHAILSEMQWIGALKDAGIAVPTIVPALDGRQVVEASGRHRDAPRQVALFEWIQGRPLGSSAGGLGGGLEDVHGVYFTVGSTMARLHDQVDGWRLPAGFDRPRWDLDGLVGEKPLWGRFWELQALTRGERMLLERARDKVRHELSRIAATPGASRHFGLIHADFVPENLLLSPDGKVSLIDFDDSGFGWHLFDIATALYFLQNDPAYETARASLLAGYRTRRELPEELLEQLPVFLTARGFTYLGWVHTRPGSTDGQAITPHLIDLACRQARRLLEACETQCRT